MQKAGDKPDEPKMVEEAIAEFPAEFGLRGFPGRVFSISRSASYVKFRQQKSAVRWAREQSNVVLLGHA